MTIKIEDMDYGLIFQLTRGMDKQYFVYNYQFDRLDYDYRASFAHRFLKKEWLYASKMKFTHRHYWAWCEQ